MANYTSVIASNICDAAGNKLASGTVSFQATDAANQPLNFQVGGGGQVVTTPATAAITTGAIAGGFQVADSANTSPAGILYRITITDTTLNRVVVTYSLVTVTGTTFNLDTYAPIGASVLPPTGGSVNGPLTVNGNLSVTGSFNPGTLGNVTSTGTVLAKSIASIRVATQFSGVDIFAQANAAFADGNNQCIVYIPAGTYNGVATTLSLPVLSNGMACLWIDPGAVINYTGTGHAIEAAGTGQSSVNLILMGGGTVVGTSSGLSGLHLKAFNKAQIYNLHVKGFTTGDAYLNEGANTIDFYGCNANTCKNGNRNVGVVVSTVNYAANRIIWHGGQITACTNWGWLEDGSLSGTVGPNEKNVALGVVFENNGTNGNANTGQAFFQKGDMCSLSHCYLEYAAGSTKTQSVLLGDGTYSAQSSSIKDCLFLSAGATTSISAFNAQGLTVADNLESGSVTNFFLLGTASRGVFIGNNRAAAATNLLAGVDNGDTESIYNSGSVTWPNAIGTTPRGLGLNQMTGLNKDLEIWLRTGGSNIVRFLFSDGTQKATIDPTGKGTFNGGVVAGTGTALARYARYTPSLSPASVAANTTAEQTFTTVLTSGDIVVGVSKPTAQAGLGIVGWRASGTSLCITFTNNTGSPITPTASETYQVVAVQ